MQTGPAPARKPTRTDAAMVAPMLDAALAGLAAARAQGVIDPGEVAVLDPARQPLALTNPISADLAAMRTSLRACARNCSRSASDGVRCAALCE